MCIRDRNKLAVETLEERGYRVLSAPDGPTALRMLDDAPPIDLLLTDVVLPNGLNGRQLSDEMLRRRPDIKVLFVTGYTRNAIIHHGRLDPDIDLLTKPFTADALTRKVRQILDGKVRTEPAAGSRSRPPTAISTNTISSRPAPRSAPASTSWWR